MPENGKASARGPEGPLYPSCNHFDPPKTKSPAPGRGGLHRGLITGLVSVTMACVGYLLAGLPPRPQGTRRGGSARLTTRSSCQCERYFTQPDCAQATRG